MQFKLSGVLCSKLDIVDDAEQTPGRSREITKFRQHCAEPIMLGMIGLHPAEKNTELSEVYEMIRKILEKHGFELKSATFHTDERDGLESAEFDVVSLPEVHPSNLMAELECLKK